MEKHVGVKEGNISHKYLEIERKYYLNFYLAISGQQRAACSVGELRKKKRSRRGTQRKSLRHAEVPSRIPTSLEHKIQVFVLQ